MESAKSSKKKPKKKPPKKQVKQKIHQTVINQIYGLLLIAISLFLTIHQYIDNQESVIGLSIEVTTLYAFGTIGLTLLPVSCILSGIFAVFSKQKLLFQVFSTLSVYISMHTISYCLWFTSKKLPLTALGYIGKPIVSTNVFLLGPKGLGIIAVFYLFTIISISLNIPILNALAPFRWLGSHLLDIIKTVSKEIKKQSSKKSFKTSLIHTLFFTKSKKKPKRKPKKTTPPSSTEPLPNPTPSIAPLSQYTLDPIDSPEPELEFKEESEHIPTPTITTAPPAPKQPTHTQTSQPNTPYQSPPIDLLTKGAKPKHSIKALTKQRVEKAAILEEALHSFNVKAKVVNITPGPTVTRYELQPGEGVKISKITALSKDISLKLAAPDIRIEAPIPGKALVGIEVPNDNIQTITLRTIMEHSNFFQSEEKLLSVLGKTITGEGIIMDLNKMPHVLIAGATGSGKSVCINSIILSILMKTTPKEVKFLMIDPKKVELSLYEGIPHLIAPVVTDPNKAAATLKKWALVEMENRYETFSKSGVKDIAGFNRYVQKQLEQNPEATFADTEHQLEPLPYIVVVIDELADLMMVASQDVEQTICRLAQMARATGIHLVIATQRPSVNVITGLIKANVPSRISFYLQSQIDSRTILDMAGAEKLLGKGDMLYSPVGSFKPSRAQGVFVSETEVKNIVDWLKTQGLPDYVDEILDVEPLESNSAAKESTDKDDLFEDAKQLIISTKYASTSFLQRKLRIGYNRAARIMEDLETEGVISEYVGEKKARNVV